MKIREPIIIVGTPRSGTSMVAGLFHCHGVFVGECREADGLNPKGYFENIELDVLRSVDLLQRRAVGKILCGQGYNGGPWLAKHTPRYHHCWREFQPKFVKVRRDTEQVLRSRIASGCFDETEAEARQIVDRDVNIMERHIKGPVVMTDEVARGSYGTLRAAMEFCGIAFSDSIADDFVEASLWHG